MRKSHHDETYSPSGQNSNVIRRYLPEDLFSIHKMKRRIDDEDEIRKAPAVEEALGRLGAGLEAAEHEEILAARREVEEGLAGDEANVLKEAVERLDRATEALAARLVEDALAARMGVERDDI